MHPSHGCGEVEEVKDRLGRRWRSFRLADADMTSCKCLRGLEKAQECSVVVEAAAVRFCALVVEKTWDTFGDKQSYVQNRLKMTPELCQEILTGTLDDVGTPQSQSLFHEANALSNRSTKGTNGMGRLDPLVTGGFPSSTEHHCRSCCAMFARMSAKRSWTRP